MAELTDLVENAQSGDLDAYSALVRRFQDMAVGYAFSVTGDFHLGEDAAQEAFVQAYRDIKTLREPAAFPGWFRQLVYKQCDRITRRKRLPSVPLAFDVASLDPGPDSILEAREAAANVRASLESLPDPERQATTMYYIGGHSQQEIGVFLGVSVDAVKNRLRSARKRMKGEMIGMVEENLSKRRPSKDESFAERVIKGLIGYTDREIQIILREVDSHDVTILLGDMDAGVRDRVFSNMSKNTSQMLRDEMTLIGRVSRKRMDEVRERVVDVIQRQGEAGVITWPVENAHPGKPGKVGPGLVALRRRAPQVAGQSTLGSMQVEDVKDLVVDLACLARGLGVLSMAEAAEAARDPFIQQAIRLVVDGYEPKLARSFLESMMGATLRHEDTVGGMVAVWAKSVAAMEPPALLEQRLRTLCRPGMPERGIYTKATAGSLKKTLAGKQLSELTLDEAANVLIEAGILARLKGVKALAGPLAEANHALLAHALEMLERDVKGDVIETILSDHQASLLARVEAAHRMVMEGLLTIQQGWHPLTIESRVKAIGGL